ncbi:MAG TPA: nucleotidyl transferase AbiEii/AbiGii toxin family protein [Candidatus Saccharimonadales bacterium]|nr:nucleotidyl transferase AbiEii/AbiGii toxin family protein [Candidatus Saccharimonadales bacterium]
MLSKTTEAAWDFLKDQRVLAGFVLVGGSALALHLRHRISEDLDFAFSNNVLPRSALEALGLIAARASISLQPSDGEAAFEEFAAAGQDLRDYQQDFVLLGSVKTSFFVADSLLAKVLGPGNDSGVRVASIPELFKSKCLVAARRSKTRDWLDLYLLLRYHNFTILDFRNAFVEAGDLSQCDIALSRMCSGVPQRGDEGYLHLLTSPPSLEEMKQFFIAQREDLEIQVARAAARK